MYILTKDHIIHPLLYSILYLSQLSRVTEPSRHFKILLYPRIYTKSYTIMLLNLNSKN